MESLQHLIYGFSQVLTFDTLLYCFIGTLIGTLIGVLPGIGPAGTLALLLPLTYKLTPLQAIIMLAGIYFGAQYGGSTTSILVNIPGEATSVVTCLDGYQMARQGRAGPALGIAAFGSFIAGCISLIGLMCFAPTLSSMALQVGPPEMFGLLCLGLTLVIYLSTKSLSRAIMMACFGIILSCIGQDREFGSPRLILGIPELLSGLDLAPIAMGLFGISEVLLNIEKGMGERIVFQADLTGLLPDRQDWKDSYKPIFRGSIVGFLLGILPGGGAIVSTFSSYALEKKLSKHPEKFGRGAIEGVAGPESANNAAAGGSFIPLFTLGLPINVSTALLLGALMIHGIAPGPLLIPKNPEIFWGLVASMYIGNVMLLIFNLPMIGIWVKVLKVPYKILFPLILLICLIGAYSLNNSTFDIFLMLGFGILGYLMQKFQYEITPLILAFVLGDKVETALRQSLLLSDGSIGIFFSRPIAAVSIILAAIVFFSSVIPSFERKRAVAVKEVLEKDA